MSGEWVAGAVSTRRTLFTTSWDDGSALDVRLGGILEQFGLRATFYATTGPRGRREIGTEELAELATIHELGNHGRTHRPFTELSDEEIDQELSWGRDQLARFGEPVPVVAPPLGRIDGRVVHVVSSLGYAIRSAPVLSGRGSSARCLEPTFMLYPHTFRTVLRNGLRRRVVPALPLLRAWGFRKRFRERVKDMLTASVRTCDAIHIWGHSDDIQTIEAWDVAEDLFRHAATLSIQPVTNHGLMARYRA